MRTSNWPFVLYFAAAVHAFEGPHPDSGDRGRGRPEAWSKAPGDYWAGPAKGWHEGWAHESWSANGWVNQWRGSSSSAVFRSGDSATTVTQVVTHEVIPVQSPADPSTATSTSTSSTASFATGASVSGPIPSAGFRYAFGATPYWTNVTSDPATSSAASTAATTSSSTVTLPASTSVQTIETVTPSTTTFPAGYVSTILITTITYETITTPGQTLTFSALDPATSSTDFAMGLSPWRDLLISTIYSDVVYSTVTDVYTIVVSTCAVTTTQVLGSATITSTYLTPTTFTEVDPTTLFLTSVLTKTCVGQACAPVTTGASMTTVFLTSTITQVIPGTTAYAAGVSSSTSAPLVTITTTITFTATYPFNALADPASSTTSSSLTSVVSTSSSTDPVSSTTSSSSTPVLSTSSSAYSSHAFPTAVGYNASSTGTSLPWWSHRSHSHHHNRTRTAITPPFGGTGFQASSATSDPSSSISSPASNASTTTQSSATLTSTTPTCSSLATTSPVYQPACVVSYIDGCQPCEGQPGTDRWCGLDNSTDYYQEWPKTCRQVICDLEISNTTMAPDGIPRLVMAFNNQLPGPLIEANWGDQVVVKLTNNLMNNGSSIHFHGVRQLYTNGMDGVPSITQCPLSGNGATMTYTWIATQYGSTWYHSHYSLQAWEGAQGPLIIHGPNTDGIFSSAIDGDIQESSNQGDQGSTEAPASIVNLGPVMISDWLHTPVFELFEFVERTGAPQQDNGLINGHNIYIDPTTNITTGSRSQFAFTPGKTHLIHLISSSLDSTFAFSIDNHRLKVISTDFVPIVPYYTDFVKIAIGQRYDILVEADQDIGSYWMRIDPLTAVPVGGPFPCGATNTMDGNIKAVVVYEGACPTTPSTTAYAHDSVCEDEPYASIVPALAKNAGEAYAEYAESVVIAPNGNTGIFRWYLSGTTFQVEFNQPTLLDVYQNNTNYAGPLAIELPTGGQWIYVIIESPIPLPHPIHLHGHDFYVVGAGHGAYSNQTLNLVNPPRRDVAILPSGGYLVLAYFTDNPGVWLMHCHIGWHVSMG